MRRIVVRERSNAGVWNQFAERSDPHGAWNHQRNRRGQGRRALRCARGHRTLRATGLAIVAIVERYPAARVGNRITHARAQRRPLQEGGENQGHSE